MFLNFVGMPVIGLGFDGDYGVYHSVYDNFYWMNHFGDPGYRYHTLMSQFWGVLALRLANADILPFDFASYARNVREFVAELEKGKDLNQLDLKPVADGIDEFEAAGRKLDRLGLSGARRRRSRSEKGRHDQSRNDASGTKLA